MENIFITLAKARSRLRRNCERFSLRFELLESIATQRPAAMRLKSRCTISAKVRSTCWWDADTRQGPRFSQRYAGRSGVSRCGPRVTGFPRCRASVSTPDPGCRSRRTRRSGRQSFDSDLSSLSLRVAPCERPGLRRAFMKRRFAIDRTTVILRLLRSLHCWCMARNSIRSGQMLCNCGKNWTLLTRIELCASWVPLQPHWQD